MNIPAHILIFASRSRLAYLIHLLRKVSKRLLRIIEFLVLDPDPLQLLSQVLQVFSPQPAPLDPVVRHRPKAFRPIQRFLLIEVMQVNVVFHVLSRLLRHVVQRGDHHFVEDVAQFLLNVHLVLLLDCEPSLDFLVPLLLVELFALRGRDSSVVFHVDLAAG